VHIRTAHLIALSLAVSWLGCRKTSTSPALTPVVPVAAGEAARAQAVAAPAAPLCRQRPRCSVTDRRPVGTSGAGGIVTVRLAASVDAATDEDRCDRREYWLTRPTGDVLLAVDCERQWGADNPGPASLTITADLAMFRYVEFLADDACETVEAGVRIPEGRVESHRRHWGKVVGNQCRPARKAAPVPAAGTGDPDSPLLVLHRP
jgi:hypothetical protein